MLILFDCDGVLVDSEIIGNRVLAALLSANGYPITAAQSRARFLGRTIPGVIDMVGEVGVRLPDDFEDQLRLRDEAAFSAELQPVPGVTEVLERLPGPRAVASSGALTKIERNLEITGLRRFFGRHLFSAEMVRHPKPAPDLFHYAMRAMGHDATETVVIEDSPLGVEGAKRAGMRVLGFHGASHCTSTTADTLRSAGADAVFDKMADLPRLLGLG